MTADGVIALQMDVNARSVVDAYLAELAAQLSGPARMHGTILAELRDGLLEAVDSYLKQGLEPSAAAAAAITEFGDPRALAAAFNPEIAMVRARYLALTLLLTGPFVGALWVRAVAGPIPPWRHELTGVWIVTPALGMAVIAGVLAAVLAVTSTGRLSRWITAFPNLTLDATAVMGASTTVADLLCLGMLATWTITAPGSLSWLWVVAAALASLARLILTGRAVPRCLAPSTIAPR